MSVAGSAGLAGIDLNLLLALEIVLAERSVVRAARRLHVTPSAISNALARLRVALGDPLVTRKGRGIVPTPRAEELAPRLSAALAELERVVTRGAFDPETCTRSFTLAMADAGQVAWLPRIVSAMGRELPNARLRVVGIASLVSLGDLGSTEVDLHVGVRASGAGIHAEPLLEEATVLVARRDHPVGRGRLTQKRLEALRHVAVEMAPGQGFRDPVAAAYAREGVARVVGLTVPTFAAAAAVAARTDLVATLPASLVEVERRGLGLRVAAGAIPRHTVQLAMCWHERTHGDPAMAALREIVRRAVVAGARNMAGVSPGGKRA